MDTIEVASLYPDEATGISARFLLEHDDVIPAPGISSDNIWERSQRQQTAEPEGVDEANADVDTSLPRLPIYVRRLPFTIGRDPGRHLKLPADDVSKKHCTISVDEDGSLVLTDSSSYGTKIWVDGNLREYHNTSYIICRHDNDEQVSVSVEIGKHFKYRIKTPKIRPQTYKDQVRQAITRNQCPGGIPDLFAGLATQSNPRTTAPSGTTTPTTRLVPVRELGRGAFAIAVLVRDMETRRLKVAKKPIPNKLDEQQITLLWRREAETMKRLKHNNIIRLLDSQKDLLVLEYAAEGPLRGQRNISAGECVSITQQCSDALSYLHRLGTVHRDIKPDNILVTRRKGNEITVKLADFGLSKQNVKDAMETKCGTFRYLAPEAVCQKYGPKVDVWGLGLVIHELLSNLPPSTGLEHHEDWCNTVAEKVGEKSSEEGPSGSLPKILAKMVVCNEKDRLSAAECYERAMKLPLPKERDYSTSTRQLQRDKVHIRPDNTDSETIILPRNRISKAKIEYRRVKPDSRVLKPSRKNHDPPELKKWLEAFTGRKQSALPAWAKTAASVSRAK